jgi:hypothetical protein
LLDAGIGLYEHDLGKRWTALYRRPPIFRGVSALQFRADHTANQSWIDATLSSFDLPQRTYQDLCDRLAFISITT